MKIFLDYDKKCLSENKILTGRIGGTERFFLLLESYLKTQGYHINQDTSYDISIHSNSTSEYVKSNYRICWCGSWTTDANNKNYNLVIANSAFMLETLNIQGIVIPACFDSSIEQFKTGNYESGKVITTSNPNRHIENTLKVFDILYKMDLKFSWFITGGNKLYSDVFPENFKLSSTSPIEYRGILTRDEMLRSLSRSHVYCYPNFSDNSETQCVSMIEAAALGIPVVAPKRRPFIDTLPDNPYFVSNINECAQTVKSIIDKKRTESRICDVSQYRENFIFDQIHNILIGIQK